MVKMFSPCVAQGFGLSGFLAHSSFFPAPRKKDDSSDARVASVIFVGRTSTGKVVATTPPSLSQSVFFLRIQIVKPWLLDLFVDLLIKFVITVRTHTVKP